jgi:hypothetical protein
MTKSRHILISSRWLGSAFRILVGTNQHANSLRESWRRQYSHKVQARICPGAPVFSVSLSHVSLLPQWDGHVDEVSQFECKYVATATPVHSSAYSASASTSSSSMNPASSSVYFSPGAKPARALALACRWRYEGGGRVDGASFFFSTASQASIQSA